MMEREQLSQMSLWTDVSTDVRSSQPPEMKLEACRRLTGGLFKGRTGGGAFRFQVSVKPARSLALINTKTSLV